MHRYSASIGLLSARVAVARRNFSSSLPSRDVLPITDLPDRIYPVYAKPPSSKLFALSWPSQPRNVLLVKKNHVPQVRSALVSLANHLKSTYPSTNIILEPSTAQSVHHELSPSFPVYALPPADSATPFPYTPSTYPRTPPLSHTHIPSGAGDTKEALYHDKTDVVITLGGDGTILHAASLFSTCKRVPPLVSFAMGTLGFLGEWRWGERETAVEMVMSGGVRVLRRERLKVGVYGEGGNRVFGEGGGGDIGDAHGMNEVIIHRGKSPHLAIVQVHVDNEFLTEAVADGMIVATPTGSTAYSLSAGGSIIHPSVSSLQLTPICARSLSFRPLVLPADTVLTLKLPDRNRAETVDLSVDGKRWGGIGRGEEVRVWMEGQNQADGEGGIPCVKGGMGLGGVGNGSGVEEDGWVGGLNGLLKFNYPFGEE